MTNEELWEWMESCPSSKWEFLYDTGESITIGFPIQTEDEEDE